MIRKNEMYVKTDLHVEYLQLKQQGFKLVGWNYVGTGGYILFKA